MVLYYLVIGVVHVHVLDEAMMVHDDGARADDGGAMRRGV